MTTDGELLDSFTRTGSEEAFRALVERYLPMVQAAAMRQGVGAEVAEDVGQAVFIVLARRAGQIRDGRLLAAWLLKVTHYCVVDARRSARRRRFHESEAAAMHQEERVASESLAEIGPHLDAALAELPALDRTLVVLRYFQQQTSPQISVSVGLTEEAARKRLSRALEKLRKFFMRRGVTLSAAVVGTAIAREAAAAPAVSAGAMQKTCAAALSSSAAGTNAALIAKGALHMLTWTGAKTIAAAAAAGLLFTVGLATAAVHFTAAPRAVAVMPVAASAAPGLTLKVVDVENRPLGNAEVAPDGVRVYYGVTSNAEGVATLKGAAASGQQFVVYSLRSRRYGLLSLLPGQSRDSVVVTADCFAADVDGIVTDASGNAVKGAGVRLFVATPTGDIYHFEGGKTDASGYFSGAIPARKGLTCWATISDDANDASGTAHIPLSDQYQFELPDLVIRTTTAAAPGGAPKRVQYGGRVVDEEGKGIAGVEVNMSYPKNHMTYEAGTVMTDGNGYFHRLLPPDADRVSFRLTARDYIGYHFVRGDLTPSSEALKAGTAVLTMKRGLPLTGTVTDAATHKPICNALVLTGRLYSSLMGEVIEDFTSPRTDAAGHFAATGIPAGKHSVEILADGYAPEIMEVDLEATSTPLQVAVQKGLSYSARVVDVHGDPLEGARVNAEEWTVDGQRIHIYRESLTDARGRFTLADLPRCGAMRVYFKAHDMVIASSTWKPGGENPTSVALYPKPVVSGTVIDDTTGEPVTKFQAFAAWYMSGKPSALEFNKSKKVSNAQGKFSLTVGNFIDGVEDRTQVAARIVADGYVPQYTPPVVQDGEEHPVTVRLHPGVSVRATIVDSEGNPVSGAKAFSVGPHDAAYVEGTAINDILVYAPRDSCTTKADGVIKLPPAESPGRVLVLHSSGYALVDASAAVASESISLTPWSVVEGDVVADGKPVNGAAVTLTPVREEPLKVPKPVQFALDASTDVRGHFRFEHVPNLPLMLGRMQSFGISNARLVHPEPGKSISVNIDELGSVEVGKMDFSGIGGPVDLQCIQARAFRVDPLPVVPAGVDDGYGWAAALGALKDREPGSEAPALVFQNLANPSTDGSLRFDNLAPGRYVAYIDVHAPQAPNTCGWGKMLAQAKVHFEITAEHPHVVLPAPTLERAKYPQVGDAAPEITGTTTDGRAFALSGLRGKYVLLHFWASWCQPCQSEMPVLKKLAGEFAGKPLVIVGGNFDWDADARAGALKEFQHSWPQLQLGELSFDQPVARAYGFSAIPFNCLISPEGKIVAENIPADQLGAVVERALR